MSAAAVPSPALAVAGLVAGYERDLPIVKGVDLVVGAGEFLAILGPNGAGKSTLAKAIAGLVSIHSGELALGTRDIAGLPAHELVRSGLAFVPQTENIFATLTIQENLQLCADVLPAARRGERIEAAYAMFPDLGARRTIAAGALSGGQRQMLATARALLVEPSVMILDEPSAGLSPKLVGEVFETLLRINEQGVTVILVEQNVRAALAVTRSALVLCDGRVVHRGPAAGLADDPRLGEMFLGRYEGQAA
ncbi:ABC transporter ATP-binding protein [Jiella endophytica]|uniref:ABC transporter ATP-binding protein n=1 Tax=Jiella endophytica TaxID=2558362 RepID=A0A4Y8RLZ8_9HYPH|nr:ABC transporter ATP-binding protein [Jiella endophytica]TFF23143.1 ABC transporter ATP-binding protein [Jiella endophytica]